MSINPNRIVAGSKLLIEAEATGPFNGVSVPVTIGGGGLVMSTYAPAHAIQRVEPRGVKKGDRFAFGDLVFDVELTALWAEIGADGATVNIPYAFGELSDASGAPVGRMSITQKKLADRDRL